MPGIFRLGYLFYPWGFIVQLLALAHFFRRRPDGFWLFVIFFGGFLGALVYLVAEVLPDAGLLRGLYQGYGRKSRIAIVETAILDNPSGFSTTRRRRISRNLASSIGTKSSMRRRRRHLTVPSLRGAIHCIPSTGAGCVSWRWGSHLRLCPTSSAWFAAMRSLTPIVPS